MITIKKLIITLAAITAMVYGFKYYQYDPRVQKWIAATFSPSIQSAYRNHESHIQVKGKGKVMSSLTRNYDGSRFQTFTVRLHDYHIVTVYHDLTVSRGIPNLQEGDEVSFYGEYRYTDAGGDIYYTNRDPKGKHVDGWVKRNDITYQ